MFSEPERKRRLENLRQAMELTGADVAVITSYHNALYYSGFWMVPFGHLHMAVVPRNGEPTLIVPTIEFDRPASLSWFKDVRAYSDSAPSLDGAVRLVGEILTDHGMTSGTIGVEEDDMTIALRKGLEKSLPGFAFVDVGEAAMRQRLVKSDEEIALIRQGAEISVVGAHAFVEAVREGATEIQIAGASAAAMEEETCRRFSGLESDATWAWCQSGPARTCLAHAPNTPRAIKKGDLLSLNCFPMIAGYYHSLERSLVYGTLSEPEKTPFEVTAEAHEAGIEAVKPGAKCSDIDRAIDPVFAAAGLLDKRTFGSGHSFGIMGQWYGREEGGELRPYNDTVLRENMVVSIEPMVAIPGVGGFRHCDMLLVTKAGNQVLTTFPRGLITV